MAVLLPLLTVTVAGSATRVLNESGGAAVADRIRFSSVMPGGFDTFECRVPQTETDAFTSVYRYGSKVTVKIGAGQGAQSGSTVWQGYLRVPVPEPDDTVTLKASGWKSLLEEKTAPLLWQSRAYGDWRSAEDDPFSFNNDDDIAELLRGGSVGFVVRKGASVKSSTTQGRTDGSRARICWWEPEVKIRRVAGRVHQNNANSNFGMRLEAFNGPWQAGADGIQLASLSSAISTAGATAFDTGTLAAANIKPMLAFGFWRSGSANTSLPNTFKTWITELKVNGDAFRTVPADWDSYVASEMAKDIAAKVSFTASSMVAATAPNFLPLWWSSGSHAECLDYLAEAHSLKWGVWEGPELEFRGWQVSNTTWTTNAYGTSATAISNIVPADDVYSHVEVIYRVQGSPRMKVLKRSTTQLTGFNPPRERTYTFRVEDSLPVGVQANDGHSQVAIDIANELVGEFATERYAGTVYCSYLTSSTEKPAVLARAGHLITISDWPGGTATFRIIGTDYDDSQGMTLTVGRRPQETGKFLSWLEKRRMRKGRIPSTPS